MIDSRDDLIALLKDKYEHEYNRKKYFEDTLGLPFTLLTALAGGIYLVIDEGTKDISQVYQIVWVALIALLIIGSVLSIFYLYKVYIKYGKEFASFPESASVKKFYEESKNYYLKEEHLDGQGLEKRLSDSLKDQSIQWYTNTNAINLATNEERAVAYYNARKFLGISVGVGILVFLFIGITKLTNSMSKQQKEIFKPNPPVQPIQPTRPPEPPPVRIDKYSVPNEKVKKG